MNGIHADWFTVDDITWSPEMYVYDDFLEGFIHKETTIKSEYGDDMRSIRWRKNQEDKWHNIPGDAEVEFEIPGDFVTVKMVNGSKVSVKTKYDVAHLQCVSSQEILVGVEKD